MHTGIYKANLKENDHVGDTGVTGRLNIKMDPK
jgi:hypothetical protein